MKITIIKSFSRIAVACFAVTIASSAFATTIAESLALFDQGKYEDAARALRAVPQPSGRANGLLCELFVKGLIADDKGDAKTVCATAADQQDPEGLLVYALAFRVKDRIAGIPLDEQRYVSYMAQAVELGYPPAYDQFCDYFYTSKAYAQATPFCKFAAANNLPRAMFDMSLMLFNGSGAVQNFDRARQFAIASARMNYAPAYKLLGDLSKEGKWGSKKDLIQAYAWYALACSAAPDWTEPVTQRNELELSDSNVAQAQKLAAQWKPETGPRLRDFYSAK